MSIIDKGRRYLNICFVEKILSIILSKRLIKNMFMKRLKGIHTGYILTNAKSISYIEIKSL